MIQKGEENPMSADIPGVQIDGKVSSIVVISAKARQQVPALPIRLLALLAGCGG